VHIPYKGGQQYPFFETGACCNGQLCTLLIKKLTKILTAACPAVNISARLQVSSNRPICQARHLPRQPVSSNWPAATPTGHFLSGPSSDPLARHVLVRLPITGIVAAKLYCRLTVLQI